MGHIDNRREVGAAVLTSRVLLLSLTHGMSIILSDDEAPITSARPPHFRPNSLIPTLTQHPSFAAAEQLQQPLLSRHLAPDVQYTLSRIHLSRITGMTRELEKRRQHQQVSKTINFMAIPIAF